MRKTISILFLLIFIFSGTEAHELFKIPHLLVHYAEHHEESNNQKSILDFLDEHYNGQEKHESDDHKDKGCLPFQGKEHVSPFNFFVLNHTTIIIFHKVLPNESVSIFFEENFISSFSGTVWQPPKIA